MTTIQNLANAFLSIEQMTNKKLQKLCYYAKAWHLALYDENIIAEPFEAWIHGPVCCQLYDKYKLYGKNVITEKPKHIDASDNLMIFVQQIYDAYGHLSGDELEITTHREEPWIEARGDSEPLQSCDAVISEDTMKLYYRGKYSNVA